MIILESCLTLPAVVWRAGGGDCSREMSRGEDSSRHTTLFLRPRSAPSPSLRRLLLPSLFILLLSLSLSPTLSLSLSPSLHLSYFHPSLSFCSLSLSLPSLSGSIREWWLQDIRPQCLLTAWARLLDTCRPHVKVWNGDTPTIRRPTNRVSQKSAFISLFWWTSPLKWWHFTNKGTFLLRLFKTHTINQFYPLSLPATLSSLSPCYPLCVRAHLLAMRV